MANHMGAFVIWNIILLYILDRFVGTKGKDHVFGIDDSSDVNGRAWVYADDWQKSTFMEMGAKTHH